MKQVKGWWFGTTDKRLLNGDGRKIVIGETHKVKGEIIPCSHGLHLSKRILDAINYAPGPVVYRVVGGGVIVPHGNPVDKYACSERTYVAGGVDVSDTLHLFARKCALDVIQLWDAPEVVVRYLKTGDESIRDAARAGAWDAARDTAWAGAWAAAWVAARSAARDAARVAAWDAAWDAAWAAAWTAAGAKQNALLTRRVNKAMKELK